MVPSLPGASSNGASRVPRTLSVPPRSHPQAPDPPPDAPGDASVMTPPVAPRRPAVLETHGDRRVDDWLWLRDRDDPEVLALLRSENAHTAAASAHLARFQEDLFGEIRGRIVETDLSVPVRKDAWWYYTRTVEGRDYAIHCRLPVNGEGRDPATPPGTAAADAGSDVGTWPGEEVLLDENLLAGDGTYLDVANLSVSPGHTRLAYAVDTTGDERFTLRIRDLATGADIPGEIEGTSYGVAWANDNETVFYTRPDAANRTYQLWRHRSGDPETPDVLVHEEPDERFHLGVERTKDGTFVLLELSSKITSEVRVIPADRPDTAPRAVERRRQGVEYQVEHHSETFLLLTNDSAENFRVVATPAADPGRDRWSEVIPHRDDVRLEGIDVFSRHLVSYERVDGNPRVRVIALLDDRPWERPLSGGTFVPIAETPSASWGGPNPEFESATLRYDYSSLVTPRTIYDLDMDEGRSVLRKRQPVLGGYDPAAYVTERLWATAPDGTRVPVSVVYRRDTPLDGSAPCLLYGYGAYEHSIDPVFSTFRLSLLERGFIFAIAHVRGGGELGRRWYEGGKLLAKPNTFTDFVACAHHLVEAGWTSADRLVARGGSAGGLLIGAVANLAPEAFRAMVSEVPFVDCLTTILDDTLPLTVIEWDEWGNPGADPQVYAVMKSYSPYDNVRLTHYPDMLVTAGLEDPRVGYWEPTKWVQKLRAADPSNRVLFKVELSAGHAGPSGRYDAWRDEAFVLAFILDAVGLAGSA
ncbi:MAG TPA: S9 family peptidase [Acidimicrobiales bacterium]|nr:S9 family peptidase [Acidimicrobiales bacterium]